MLNFPYDAEQKRNGSLDYDLVLVANACLRGKDSAEVARQICQIIAECLHQYRISSFDYPHLLGCLARLHPDPFLDIFVGSELDISFPGMRFDDLERDDNPVNQIPENVLIEWCEKDPKARYLQLVPSLQTYRKIKETGELSWNPMIYSILEKTPNFPEVLLRLQSTLLPSSWSGSYADMLEKRLILFTSLYEYPNPLVQDWAKEQYLRLKNTINEQRENELRRNQVRFERFE
jgi:hypothetical protein